MVAADALEKALEEKPEWREFTGTDEVIDSCDELIGDHQKREFYRPMHWTPVSRFEVGKPASYFITLRFRTRRPLPQAKCPRCNAKQGECWHDDPPQWRGFFAKDEQPQPGDEYLDDAGWHKALPGQIITLRQLGTWSWRTKRPPSDVTPSTFIADQMPEHRHHKKWQAEEEYYDRLQEAIGTNCNPQPIKKVTPSHFYQIAKDLAETASAAIAMYKQGTPPPQLVLGLFNEACAAYDKAVENLLQDDSDSLL